MNTPKNTSKRSLVTLDLASMTAEDFAKAARADSTRRENAKDLKYFVRDGGTLPAPPAVMVQWLTKVASLLAPATIQRRMISVGIWHQENGHATPLTDAKVKRVFAGIGRTVGLAQRRVTPLVRDDLLAVLEAVEKQKPLRAARDSALILVMFCAALRRGSAVNILVEDLTEHAYGVDLLLRKSKTDQGGKGLVVSIPFAMGDKCPVKAIAKWRALSGIQSGILFRAVNKHDQVSDAPLHADSVCRIFKKAIALSGRDAEKYSSHSTRAGFVTSAAAAQMPLAEISQVTKHRGMQSLQRYLRVVDQRRTKSLL
jgi:integrase